MAWMQILISLVQLNFAQEIHGHRGARAIYPENTLAAFEYALLFGADYIEVDTHMTKDEVIVIHHDPSVNKDICQSEDGSSINKKILIVKTELADLQRFDCGTKTLPAFPRQISMPGAKIPTLQEVMLLFRVHALINPLLRLNIEIKYNDDSNYPDLKQYVDTVMNLVYDNGLENYVIYQSFSKDVVKYIRQREEAAIVYFLTANPFTNLISILRETGADGASIAHQIVSENTVNKIRNMGRKILSWTVNDKKDWQRLMSLRVDGIITDDPEGLYKYKKEVSQSAHLYP
jgi:glycerophosphoryl diester phosphodiesterase